MVGSHIFNGNEKTRKLVRKSCTEQIKQTSSSPLYIKVQQALKEPEPDVLPYERVYFDTYHSVIVSYEEGKK